LVEKFKILTPREHVRERAGMYLGSVSQEIVDRFVGGVWNKVTYVPALSKMVDEILDNSVDEFIRTKGKYANKIDVSVNGNSISITDNGRGIPHEKVHDGVSGKDILRPVAAWTRVNAGTSFDDARVTIGTNGVGSAATNFMSVKFVGETWYNGSCVVVSCSDGANNIDVKTVKKNGHGTKVTFEPDFSLLEVSDLNSLDTIELIQDRLVNLQLCFPEVVFTFNGEKLIAPDVKKYAALFGQGTSVITKKDNLSFFFMTSEDGFRTNSFVNGVNTRQGGSYVDFVVNGVVENLVKLIKRRYKVEVAPSTVKGGLTFILFARNFENPKFDSQTKERLTSPVGAIKSHYDAAGGADFAYLAKKVMEAEDIIAPIVEAQIAKKLAQDKREATIAQKKLKKARVAKHVSANNDKAILALVEGDCLSTDTLIETLEGLKKIGDVSTEDYVFTHKHRYRRIVSKSFALKDGLKINGVIMSKNHKMFVYDTVDRVFDVIPAEDIKKDRHKLIRNRVVANGIEKSLHIVRKKNKNGFETDTLTMHFSKTHEIICMNVNLECEIRTIDAISVGDVVML
jgi:DNA gyrase/topoisomerase IV subunit B